MPEETSFIAISMEDEFNNPMVGVRYQVELPDGRLASGRLNDKGEARLNGIPPGTCKIRFPNIDTSAYE